MDSGGIDLKWLIGQGVAIALAGIGGLWKVSSKASAGDRALYTKIDEVKKDYVRRDDHKDDMQKIDKQLEKMDDKLDQLIARK